MLGAIYIGLSGLKAYQDGLTAVSNNVTNLNSLGFKASEVTFSDVFGAGRDGGSSLGVEGGSRGYGVSLGHATVDFGQGELRQTDRDLDLAIEGSGFLVLMDGAQLSYVRTGSFAVGEDGHVVLNGTELRLASLGDDGKPVALDIDAARTSRPSATTTVTFADNLSSTATSFSLGDVKLFDAAGKEHVWRLAFAKHPTELDRWTVTMSDQDGGQVGSATLRFQDGAVDPATATLRFRDKASGLDVAFDFADATSFSSGEISTLRATSVDGYGLGSISRIGVNDEGKVEIAYTNGQTDAVGSIAVADFRDPQSLKQVGQGRFAVQGRDEHTLTTSEDPRVGRVRAGRLEASNVDLGQQFGDLILIQRGFQASSQIVSVSNDMIQQLFGIRAQG